MVHAVLVCMDRPWCGCGTRKAKEKRKRQGEKRGEGKLRHEGIKRRVMTRRESHELDIIQ